MVAVRTTIKKFLKAVMKEIFKTSFPKSFNIFLILSFVFLIFVHKGFSLSKEFMSESSKAFINGERADPKSSLLKSVVSGNNRFAFVFYKRICSFEKDGYHKSDLRNVFFSPCSLSLAFAMTYSGAKGNTKAEIARVFHFSLPQNSLDFGFFLFLKQLESDKGKGCRLLLANALWGQKGYRFLKDYLDLVQRYYCGGFFEIDFQGNRQIAVKRINKWVEKRTFGKIKDLIKICDVNSLTKLILTNAIYFKGIWEKEFDKKETRISSFYCHFGKVEIPMMRQRGKFRYLEVSGRFQAIELFYHGGDFSMLIFLPAKRDGICEFEKSLNIDSYSGWISRMRKRDVVIYLPKFKLDTKYHLCNILKSMGIKEAFSYDADFSGITGKKDLMISKVIHQAYVEVDEKGTEAAAATGVEMQVKAVFSRPKVFKADHPFFFLIIHKGTGSIIFMGRVVDPRK